MLSIVFGLIALCLGFWSVIRYWWYMVDVLIAILPLLLIAGGSIALLAGIKNTGIRTSIQKNVPEEEPVARKTDI
ncbi:MAG: hypothetical protein OEV89_07310 [Desulfobulbaceae bacterium]|nr:hypothetical protein [Desulfobulbaceae bacterium]HIJ90560.1 hypothetical protein [Deltaproteobacteria bacterium]